MKEFNKPTRLTLTNYGNTHTVEYPYSDITMDDYITMCRSLALANGFAEKVVNARFGDE